MPSKNPMESIMREEEEKKEKKKEEEEEEHVWHSLTVNERQIDLSLLFYPNLTRQFHSLYKGASPKSKRKFFRLKRKLLRLK